MKSLHREEQGRERAGRDRADTAFNRKAAAAFRECAVLLRQQRANPFRVNAYLHAAQTLESLDVDVTQLLDSKGIDGLVTLPAIGRGLASSIEEIARTGRLSLLDQLRGESAPEALFTTIPGVGPELARRISETLHVDTLEALEVAAHDGSLERVPGIGPRRAEAIRSCLATVLANRRGRRRLHDVAPAAAAVLDVDREYRERAAADRLPKIAPRRFNPEGRAWLPILHTDRDGWHFTALYSNTARAHDLGRTGDWVVIYFYDGDHREGQCTVVTETHGPAKGERVIRGREAESRRARRS
ncbi:MAG TPA: helix-hairpin-helix domain-containing protein [Woeseiaceae bacterium]